MYREHNEFDPKGNESKAVLHNLSILNGIFSEKTPELERYNVVSLYCIIAELDRQYVLSEIKDKISE